MTEPVVAPVARSAPAAAANGRRGVARALAIGAGAVLLAIAVPVATHPLWLASLVSRQLSATSGRDVHFDSIRVGLDASLRPVVHLQGVRIANAAWADPRWPLAEVRAAIAIVSWRSVAQRRPVIERMILRDGRVDLERLADGTRNWRLRRPADRGPGRYKVLSLQAENSDVRIVHRGVDLVIEATARPAESGATNASGEPLPTQIALQGQWRGAAYSADFATAAALTFFETDTLFALRGSIDAGDTRIALDGRAGDILRLPRLEAALDVRGQTLAVLRVFVGDRFEGQPKKPYRLSAEASVSGRTYTLDRLRAKVGASDFAGTLAFVGAESPRRAGGLESAGSVPASGSTLAARASSAAKTNGAGVANGVEPRDLIRAELASDLVDVADLEWLIGDSETRRLPARAAAHAPARRGTAPPPASASAASAAVAPASASASAASAVVSARAARSAPAAAPTADRKPRPLDADRALDAKRVRSARFPWLERARLRATSRDRVVTVSSFEAGVAGGVASGSLTLDRSREPMRGEVDATVRGVRLESLLRGQDDKKRITGLVALRARLDSAGTDGDTLLAAMTGRIDASLSDGSLSSLLDAGIGLQGMRALRSWLGSPAAVPVRCARVVLDVRRGSGRIRELVLDTARTLTRGSGTIDFVRQTLDVTVTPQAKDAGVLVIDRSIRFHGPLAKPERELVARVEVPAATCAAK